MATLAFFTSGSGPLVAGEPAERPNFLVCFIDTLRADHVSCYGYRRPTTPTIDELAGSGTVFETAVSQCTWSLPSYATLFTSLYPPVHGLQSMGSALGAQWPTLAEVMWTHGYDTAAFAGGGHLGPKFGLKRGFNVYDSGPVPASLASSVTNAIRWLDARQPSPFLLFVHGYDCHTPYQAPLGYAEMYDPDYKGPVHSPGFLSEQFLTSIDAFQFDPCGLLSTGQATVTTITYPSDPAINPEGWLTGPAGLPLRLPLLRQEVSGPDRAHLVAHYDGAITYADTALARMLDALQERNLLQNTVVIVAGDHGEHLFEQGHLTHGGFPVEMTIHVPLVISGPGVAKARRIGDAVGLIDLAPTVLALSGISPCHTFQGQSITRYLTTTAPPPPANPDQPAFSCNGRSYSIRTADWHLLQHPGSLPGAPEVTLYRVTTDPSEMLDVAERHPAVFKKLLNQLDEWREKYDKPTTLPSSNLNKAEMDMFRAFGYW